jgi:hypothetical protein
MEKTRYIILQRNMNNDEILNAGACTEWTISTTAWTYQRLLKHIRVEVNRSGKVAHCKEKRVAGDRSCRLGRLTVKGFESKQPSYSAPWPSYWGTESRPQFPGSYDFSIASNLRPLGWSINGSVSAGALRLSYDYWYLTDRVTFERAPK